MQLFTWPGRNLRQVLLGPSMAVRLLFNFMFDKT